MKAIKNISKVIIIGLSIAIPLSVQGQSNEINECSIEYPLNCNLQTNEIFNK
jgi:hypothetical protein